MAPSLSDLLVKPVVVILGGRRWPLLVTYRTLLECENATGVDMLRTMDLWVDLNAQQLRTLLWILLRRTDEHLSEWEAGSFLSPEMLHVLPGRILEAYRASMPPRRKRKQPKEDEREGDAASGVSMGWVETRAAARIELRLADDEWLDMTPLEFNAMRVVRVRMLHDSEYMMGQLIAAVKNHSMRPLKKPAMAGDFVMHRLPVDDSKPVGNGAYVDHKTGTVIFEAA